MEARLQKHRESIYWEKAAKEQILETKAINFAPLENQYLEQQGRLHGHKKNKKSDDSQSSSESRLVIENEKDA